MSCSSHYFLKLHLTNKIAEFWVAEYAPVGFIRFATKDEGNSFFDEGLERDDDSALVMRRI
jgi:hypothetical protein